MCFSFPLLKGGRLEREVRHSGILEKAQAWCLLHAAAIALNITMVLKGVFPLLRRLLAGGGTEQRAGQSLHNLHWAASRRAGL